MAYPREYLLITHTSDSVKLALEVLVEGYDGDITVQHAQVERNMSGDLLIKKGVQKRIFVGAVAVDDDATGTILIDSVTYTHATPALIKACWGVLDLKVKGFTDAAFWDGWITGDHAPKAVYEPTGEHRVMPLEIVER